MCLGSLYTQMQIANFMRRLGVFLNSDSKPWPAGCCRASLMPIFLNDLISSSLTLIGNTFSSSNLSGWFGLRLMTLRPSSLCSLISEGIRNIFGKKSCFSRILSQSGYSRASSFYLSIMFSTSVQMIYLYVRMAWQIFKYVISRASSRGSQVVLLPIDPVHQAHPIIPNLPIVLPNHIVRPLIPNPQLLILLNLQIIPIPQLLNPIHIRALNRLPNPIPNPLPNPQPPNLLPDSRQKPHINKINRKIIVRLIENAICIELAEERVIEDMAIELEVIGFHEAVAAVDYVQVFEDVVLKGAGVDQREVLGVKVEFVQFVEELGVEVVEGGGVGGQLVEGCALGELEDCLVPCGGIATQHRLEPVQTLLIHNQRRTIPIQIRHKIPRNLHNSRIINLHPATFLQPIQNPAISQLNNNREMGPQIGGIVQADQECVQPVDEFGMLIAGEFFDVGQSEEDVDVVAFADEGGRGWDGLACFDVGLEGFFVQVAESAQVVQEGEQELAALDAGLVVSVCVQLWSVLVLYPFEYTQEELDASLKRINLIFLSNQIHNLYINISLPFFFNPPKEVLAFQLHNPIINLPQPLHPPSRQSQPISLIQYRPENILRIDKDIVHRIIGQDNIADEKGIQQDHSRFFVDLFLEFQELGDNFAVDQVEEGLGFQLVLFGEVELEDQAEFVVQGCLLLQVLQVFGGGQSCEGQLLVEVCFLKGMLSFASLEGLYRLFYQACLPGVLGSDYKGQVLSIGPPILRGRIIKFLQISFNICISISRQLESIAYLGLLRIFRHEKLELQFLSLGPDGRQPTPQLHPSLLDISHEAPHHPSIH